MHYIVNRIFNVGSLVMGFFSTPAKWIYKLICDNVALHIVVLQSFNSYNNRWSWTKHSFN